MSDKLNRSRILLNKGNMYWDGEIIADGIKCEIIVTPKVTTSKSLNETVPSSRWAGIESIKATVTEYRSTARAKNLVKNYLETGETPEVTIQGTQDDENSDYYEAIGKETVTALGCVPTDAIKILSLDASSDEHLQDEMSFNVKDLKF
ncbi:MAG: phage tail tube protein [Clostridia bacterium]|nr:phage tail tube protein [Clostridia bacterium]